MARGGRGKWRSYIGNVPVVVPAAPAWVPANAVIYIDFLGGSPQGRAWSNGAEVAIATLVGSDPAASGGYGSTSYQPTELTPNGLNHSGATAFIGAAKTRLLAGATVRFATKRNDVARTSGEVLVMVNSDGNFGLEVLTRNTAPTLRIGSYVSSPVGGSGTVNTTGAMNATAYTVTPTRLEAAVNGGAAVATTMTEDDWPSGDPMLAALFQHGANYAYIQSITIYDPLPTTAGLSELSAVS